MRLELNCAICVLSLVLACGGDDGGTSSATSVSGEDGHDSAWNEAGTGGTSSSSGGTSMGSAEGSSGTESGSAEESGSVEESGSAETGGQPLDCTDNAEACPDGFGCACGGPGPGPHPCACGLLCETETDCTNPAQPVCCGGTCTDDCTCYCD